jgi:hypothetical protein
MRSSESIHCFKYEACDIPPGTTIETWKRERAREAARSDGRTRLVRSLFRRAR